MTWYAYAAVAVIVLSTLLTINNVGKPRESTTTPEVALGVLLLNGLVILVIVLLAARGGC
jgi:putative copper export protein